MYVALQLVTYPLYLIIQFILVVVVNPLLFAISEPAPASCTISSAVDSIYRIDNPIFTMDNHSDSISPHLFHKLTVLASILYFFDMIVWNALLYDICVNLLEMQPIYFVLLFLIHLAKLPLIRIALDIKSLTGNFERNLSQFRGFDLPSMKTIRLFIKCLIFYPLFPFIYQPRMYDFFLNFLCLNQENENKDSYNHHHHHHQQQQQPSDIRATRLYARPRLAHQYPTRYLIHNTNTNTNINGQARTLTNHTYNTVSHNNNNNNNNNSMVGIHNSNSDYNRTNIDDNINYQDNEKKNHFDMSLLRTNDKNVKKDEKNMNGSNDKNGNLEKYDSSWECYVKYFDYRYVEFWRLFTVNNIFATVRSLFLICLFDNNYLNNNINNNIEINADSTVGEDASSDTRSGVDINMNGHLWILCFIFTFLSAISLFGMLSKMISHNNITFLFRWVCFATFYFGYIIGIRWLSYINTSYEYVITQTSKFIFFKILIFSLPFAIWLSMRKIYIDYKIFTNRNRNSRNNNNNVNGENWLLHRYCALIEMCISSAFCMFVWECSAFLFYVLGFYPLHYKNIPYWSTVFSWITNHISENNSNILLRIIAFNYYVTSKLTLEYKTRIEKRRKKKKKRKRKRNKTQSESESESDDYNNESDTQSEDETEMESTAQQEGQSQSRPRYVVLNEYFGQESSNKREYFRNICWQDLRHHMEFSMIDLILWHYNSSNIKSNFLNSDFNTFNTFGLFFRQSFYLSFIFHIINMLLTVCIPLIFFWELSSNNSNNININIIDNTDSIENINDVDIDLDLNANNEEMATGAAGTQAINTTAATTGEIAIDSGGDIAMNMNGTETKAIATLMDCFITSLNATGKQLSVIIGKSQMNLAISFSDSMNSVKKMYYFWKFEVWLTVVYGMFVALTALLLPYIFKFKYIIAHFYFNLKHEKCNDNQEGNHNGVGGDGDDDHDDDGSNISNDSNQKIATQTMLYHIDKLYHRILYYPGNKRILCDMFGKDIASLILQYLPNLTLNE